MSLDYIAESLRPLAVPITQLIRDPVNSRLHPQPNLDGIAASLRVYGQRKPIVVNRRTGIVEAGNGTLDAAQAIGWTHLAAVYVDDDPNTAAGFSIADNRTAELATWDATALDVLLREVQTNDAGLQQLFSELRDGLVIPDLALPEPGGGGDEFDSTLEEGPTRTNAGELWVIGGVHRLLVDDCTVQQNVQRLMGDEKAAICFTDPPYNVDLGTSKAPSRCSTQRSSQIPGDNRSDTNWIAFIDQFAARILENVLGDIYVWGGCGCQGERMRLRLIDLGWHWSATIVWRKHHFVMSHSNYHRQHELCFYGWMDRSSYVGDLTQSDVWDVDRPMASPEHPTMKPVALAERALTNSSRRGETVLDLFLGSGTTLVAAHRLNRKCYGCEIEPRFADVVLKRAEDEGLHVEKVS
jgi:DNA modification methylase